MRVAMSMAGQSRQRDAEEPGTPISATLRRLVPRATRAHPVLDSVPWLAFALAINGCGANGDTPSQEKASDSGVASDTDSRPSISDAVASSVDASGKSGDGSMAESEASPLESGESSVAFGADEASAAHDAAPDTAAMTPTGKADSGLSSDSSVSLDSGPSADELAWLTPMNAARAMVGEAPLGWDPIAAQVALAYVSKCVNQHNLNAGAQYDALGGKGGLGENIAAGAPSQTVASAVSSWISEKVNYDHATNTCAAGMCGHYTQIVWSTTTAVGCAQASCTTNSPFGTLGNGMWDFEVCDFSPPGNYVSKAPY
jgi:pathogenesis-related protein 1